MTAENNGGSIDVYFQDQEVRLSPMHLKLVLMNRKGMEMKTMAEQLGISVYTVSTHIQMIKRYNLELAFAKLGRVSTARDFLDYLSSEREIIDVLKFEDL